MVFAMALILLVEDDRNITAAMVRALTDAGHVVRPVGQATEALKVVTEDQPDLVILDLGLPDIDGTDALRMMRSVSAVPSATWRSTPDSAASPSAARPCN
jgi:DNA-binding response OmpR family regulator